MGRLFFSRSFLTGGLFAVALALFCAGAARADLDLKTRMKVFDQTWTRVRDYHWDPTLGGVDWAAAQKRYRPQAKAAASDMAFFVVLQRMLGELKQSHFGIIPPETFLAQVLKSGGDGKTGLTIGLVENEATILAVEPGSSAEKAGLRPGLTVTEVDGKLLAPIVAKLRERRRRPAEEGLYIRQAIGALLAGAPDSDARIAYRDENDLPALAELKRMAPEGEIGRFGNLPPIPVTFEQRRLDGGVGYIRFNIFLNPTAMLARIQSALTEMTDAPGVIIDVRGNPGGLGIMANAIAGYLAVKPGNLGTMKTRRSTLSFPVFPQKPQYAGPVVILTDEGSASTSEILAGGLQENKRAVIVGRTTPGMVLPSQIVELAGGVRLQCAYANFKTPKGVLLEGRGVVPDIAVPLTRKSLLASPDPILDAALTHLKKVTETK